jgi:hypothetical protein
MMDRRKWVVFAGGRNQAAPRVIVSAATTPSRAARGTFARTGVQVAPGDRILGRLPCPG